MKRLYLLSIILTIMLLVLSCESFFAPKANNTSITIGLNILEDKTDTGKEINKATIRVWNQKFDKEYNLTISSGTASGSISLDNDVYSFQASLGHMDGDVFYVEYMGELNNVNISEGNNTVNINVYSITVAAPTFNPPEGTYTGSQSVIISCATAGATIRYTTNGSDPTATSAVYSSPVNISSTTTLKAKGFKEGWNTSSTATADYAISEMQTVATPTFNPSGGTYTGSQSVTISCATAGATIRYSTDGSEPTSSSPVYSSPVNISSTTTLKAKGFKDGWNASSTATAAYNITGTVATPTFNPVAGTYTTAQSVTISCATSGATIRYTTNGSDPTTNSPAYSSPVNISSTTTLKAKGFKEGWNTSSTATANYTISDMQTVSIPTFNPSAGTYTEAQSVTISCVTSGATIRYTTNGSDPTSSSPVYSSPVNISSTTTLKAKGFKDGWNASSTATAAYNITGTV
ncbi:MAG: chitobiase/beta-hexosaminidase C-terminal domain-containing protein, partial [Candidatus Cloacimonetes bacterium]|nr:chitobiase/beta-hexosaminidase C-terminal domain-containing protein [Candidatus Cloacimonadota bacterium]